MSDALTYLLKVRPEAMGSYFKFLKEAGAHLDPKTRALISVITKVHAQTERGFRQYLSRALRAGCSAQEVLDALLMAFPALGLTRITWAVDILLEMDLPEFRPESLGVQGVWHDLAAADALAAGEVARTDCDGRSVFIYRAAEGHRVYDSRCPHQVTDIPHLALQGTTLTCPKHGWVFDLRSGECIEKGTSPLKQRKTRVQDGRLLAYW
jgi:nitrite reductase/ring-hydroxylating ferredoxin subunit/alkylhydroperoxidase/carboxymuconolactone decarboxylase family protein YurZ